MENTPIIKSSIKFIVQGVIAVILLTWLWPLRSVPIPFFNAPTSSSK